MNWDETLEYLYNSFPMFQYTGKAGYKPGLNRTIELDDLYGNPSVKFKSIHIAGTNGKGSVSHMLASILQEAGFNTGLYTSPHLKDFRERIKINGQMIPKEYVMSFIQNGKEHFENIRPSFFELTTILAFDYFAENNVDIAVIETGMGGRLDSTNIITPELSVVTNIGWDHMAYLGNNLRDIAGEKAGIIKCETPIVLGEPDEEILPVFLSKAGDLSAPLINATDMFSLVNTETGKETGQIFTIRKNIINNDNKNNQSRENNQSDERSQSRENNQNRERNESNSIVFRLGTDLAGIHQKHNIITLCAALETLKNNPLFSPCFKDSTEYFGSIVVNGLINVSAATGLSGRWQFLSRSPMVIADTAHNKNGLKLSLEQVSSIPHTKLRFVIGFMNDKDIDSILPLFPSDAVYYFTKAAIPRSMQEADLQKFAAKYKLNGNCFSSVKQALTQAINDSGKNDFIYVGGSTFIVAEALP